MPFRFDAHHLGDVGDAVHVGGAGQAERPAFRIGASGAADAVDVDLGIGGDVDVDDGFELRDVQTACGHVGGHQHRATAVGELNQHLVAFALFHVAVQRQRVYALGMQHVEQIAALLLGVAEGQRADRAVVLEQDGDGLQAIFVFDLVEALADLACTRAVPAASLPAACA